MKFMKNLFVIVCFASAQLSCVAQGSIDQAALNISAKEIQLIQTNRIIESLKTIVDTVEQTRDWSIFHNATTPSRQDSLKSYALQFAETLQAIVNEHAICTQTATPIFFGLSTVEDFFIVDNKEAGLKIFGNKDFLKLLEKATKLFEASFKSCNDQDCYYPSMKINIAPAGSISKEVDLHQFCAIIKKAIDKA